MPLLRDELVMDYDVVADEAPHSTNMKERVWAILTEMLPTLMKAGVPVPPEVITYAPIPEDLAMAWEKLLQPDPQQQQAQQLQAQLESDAKAAETEETRSKTVLNMAKARSEAADTGKKVAGG